MPIMGICLGHQLIALAAGARTVKLPYGNRAHNIPALDLTTGRCHITSQNHGYAVDAKTLPEDWKEYFVNLNDGSNEGIIHKTRPIFGTQYHPESAGGPKDATYLFDAYLASAAEFKKSKAQGENRPSPLLADILAKERVGVTATAGMRAIERAKAERMAGAPLAGTAKIPAWAHERSVSRTHTYFSSLGEGKEEERRVLGNVELLRLRVFLQVKPAISVFSD